MGETSELHLPDLHISGFRGIDELTIPRLGRVTLLVGKNGVGKTSVLDAVRVYAARVSLASLVNVLERHGEQDFRDDSAVMNLSWSGLFTGRLEQSSSGTIEIQGNSQSLRIETTSLNPELQYRVRRMYGVSVANIPALNISFGKNAKVFPAVQFARGMQRSSSVPEEFASFEADAWQTQEEQVSIPCWSLGPDAPRDEDVADYWDQALAYGRERLAVDAIRLVLDGIEDVVLQTRGRAPLARVQSWSGRVSLKSLGEGAIRLFGVGLALASARDGFLLIDEAENGLHHSVQPAFWRMVFQAAEVNNVQVIATTHSFDCVRGFAAAAEECKNADGILARLTRHDGTLQAKVYSEKNLRVAVEHEMEVR